jgi:hypothetical protein
VPDFDALHSRVNDQGASACAFDLLMLNGDDMRRRPYVERKAALRKLLRTVAVSSTSNTLKVTATDFSLPLASSGWRASFQRNSMRRIARGRREFGSRSKIRKRLLRHV